MRPIKILHLENDPFDVELVKSILDEQGLECDITDVETEADFVSALTRNTFDLILADYILPSFDGLSALKIVKKDFPEIPFILLSGSIGEEYAIESLKNGATDYVLKTNMERLVPAINRALHEKEESTKRREAETSILRLKTAIENSSDSIMITDPDGSIEYANPALAKNTGYRLEELIGQKPSILKSGIHDQKFYEDLWETITSGKTWRGVMINRKKDDTLYTEETSISPITTQKGEISGFVAIKRDISETIELESKKHQSQLLRRRLADIFLNVSDEGMFEKMLKLILENLQSNDGLFGYFDENKDLIIPSLAGDVWDKCNVADRNNVFPHKEIPPSWSRTINDRKGYYTNEPVKVPEGHFPIANVMTMPLVSKGMAIGLLVIANKKTGFTDDDFAHLEGLAEYISPILYARLERNRQEEMRLQAEKKLQDYSLQLELMVESRTQELNSALLDAERSRDWFDGIIRFFAGGLLVTDKSESIVLMNRYAEIYFNTRFSDVRGTAIQKLFDREEIWERVRSELDKQDIYSFEFNVLDPKSNKKRIIRAKVSGIYDRKKERTANVIVLDDITQDREIEKLKTEFISIAAHQFRTPLTSIQGFSEILLTENDITSTEREKFLSYINQQAIKLASLISDLLDLSRIEAETFVSLETSLCSASKLLNDMLPVLQESYPRHEFKVVSLEQPDEMLVNREMIEQVFNNLLSNAANYSPLGGVISISGALLDGFYQLSIADEGVGMTPEQVEKIFDKFYRVDKANTAVTGTGLGLCIVRDIIERHGGKVTVESNLGEGTKVFFTVPTQNKEGGGI